MRSISLVVGVALVGVVLSQGTWSSFGTSIPRIGSSGTWNSISHPRALSTTHVGRTVFGGHSGGRAASALRPPVPGPERILGRTVLGRPARFGELGLPRNGGAGAGRAHANGIRGGWDGNPRTLHMFHHSWQDPLGGRSLPVGWNGDFGSISHLFG